MNQVHLRITVSKVNQTSKGDERMSEGFIWCDPLVWINNESLLQQVCKLIPLEEQAYNYYYIGPYIFFAKEKWQNNMLLERHGKRNRTT